MTTEYTLQRALQHFGFERQRVKLFEEMAELQDALCKADDGRASVADIITEIADVQIVLDQMKIHFGEGAVRQEIYNKLVRLKKRMDYDQ